MITSTTVSTATGTPDCGFCSGNRTRLSAQLAELIQGDAVGFNESHVLVSRELRTTVGQFHNLGGLFQRASIITGFAWLTALSAQALRRMPTTAAAPPPTGARP